MSLEQLGGLQHPRHVLQPSDELAVQHLFKFSEPGTENRQGGGIQAGNRTVKTMPIKEATVLGDSGGVVNSLDLCPGIA